MWASPSLLRDSTGSSERARGSEMIASKVNTDSNETRIQNNSWNDSHLRVRNRVHDSGCTWFTRTMYNYGSTKGTIFTWVLYR